jgi:hypothetical protein
VQVRWSQIPWVILKGHQKVEEASPVATSVYSGDRGQVVGSVS